LLERGGVLGRPSLLDPLAERRPGAGELDQCERPELAAADLGVPRLGVGAAIEAAGAVVALFVPADLPSALKPADAHDALRL
jgi:hypothetical protein